MLKAEKKLNAILKKSNAAGVKPNELLKLKVVQNLQLHCNYCYPWMKYKKIVLKTIAVIVLLYFTIDLTTNFDYQVCYNVW